MNCPICKHGTLRSGFASATLERGGAVLVFKDVPSDICDTCGAIFPSDAVTRAL